MPGYSRIWISGTFGGPSQLNSHVVISQSPSLVRKSGGVLCVTCAQTLNNLDYDFDPDPGPLWSWSTPTAYSNLQYNLKALTLASAWNTKCDCDIFIENWDKSPFEEDISASSREGSNPSPERNSRSRSMGRSVEEVSSKEETRIFQKEDMITPIVTVGEGWWWGGWSLLG